MLTDAVAKIGYTITPVVAGEARRVSPIDTARRPDIRAAWPSALRCSPFLRCSSPCSDRMLAGRWQPYGHSPPPSSSCSGGSSTVTLRSDSAWSANMDTLVSMGTLAAYGWSVYAFFADEHVFFETAAVIVTFLLLGRLFEARSKGRASSAITRLLEMGAREAGVLRDGVETMVPADQILAGDRMVIRPGEKVPTDGRIVEGGSSFDEHAHRRVGTGGQDRGRRGVRGDHQPVRDGRRRGDEGWSGDRTGPDRPPGRGRPGHKAPINTSPTASPACSSPLFWSSQRQR